MLRCCNSWVALEWVHYSLSTESWRSPRKELNFYCVQWSIERDASQVFLSLRSTISHLETAASGNTYLHIFQIYVCCESISASESLIIISRKAFKMFPLHYIIGSNLVYSRVKQYCLTRRYIVCLLLKKNSC